MSYFAPRYCNFEPLLHYASSPSIRLDEISIRMSLYVCHKMRAVHACPTMFNDFISLSRYTLVVGKYLVILKRICVVGMNSS